MAKSDYCARQAKPLFDNFKKENPKLSIFQIAEKIRPLISKIDGSRYSTDVIIRSIQSLQTDYNPVGMAKAKHIKIDLPLTISGRDRDSTFEDSKCDLKQDGVSITPASTDFCFDIEIPPSTFNPERFKTLHIPKDNYKLLLLYDIHIPFHDADSLRLAIRHGKDNGVDEVFIMGDGIDFYGFSKFEKRKHHRDPVQEVATAEIFLQNLRRYMPTEKITWKEGNHEIRYERYIMSNSPELQGLRGHNFESVMNLKEYGVDHIKDKTIIKAGKLNIIHGHEIAGGGENVARNKMKRAMANIIFGHSHLSQSTIVRSIDGSHFGSWGVGALCHRSPDYNPFNQWLAGFAIVTLQTNGNFLVENKIIIDGQIRNG